ncbi:MAG: hypothetical protein U9O89_05915 [Thermoproteota archaeon]|nr:hypothetical protein [Thermoproteota archaeon]
MVKKLPEKDEALEAVDFIINVLKEHEKDLDRLISELGRVTEQLGDSGKLSDKIEKVEERLLTIQNEVSNLIKFVSSPRETPVLPRNPPVIVRCKQWEDFKVLASGAETVSFLYKEAERSFQADALRNGRVLTYSGDFPGNAELLKIWLSKELNVAEEDILEGILAIG